MPARACQLPVGVDQRQRFDVVDEGRERQPAAVDVRRQRTAEAEVVGAGLLLADRPAARVDRMRGEPGEQGGPADAGLNGDPAAGVAESSEERRVGKEGVRTFTYRGGTK